MRAFFAARVGRKVVVGYHGMRGPATVVGHVVEAGESTVTVRTDRPVVRDHIVALASIVNATEKMPHGSQGNRTSHART